MVHVTQLGLSGYNFTTALSGLMDLGDFKILLNS